MSTHTDNEELAKAIALDTNRPIVTEQRTDDYKKGYDAGYHAGMRSVKPTPQAAVQGDDIRRELLALKSEDGYAVSVLVSPTALQAIVGYIQANYIPRINKEQGSEKHDINRNDKDAPTKSSGELEEILSLIYSCASSNENLRNHKARTMQEWFAHKDADLNTARAAVLSWHTTQTTKLQADLAWCLGKLRGLGHPAERLEREHKVKSNE